MNTITGQCHCGKNEFSVGAESQFQFICYCKNCRVINSGGHLCGLGFPEDSLTLAAETQTYTYQGGSGNDIHMHFCPTCGTHLYAYPTEYPGMVVVRANTLTDNSFKPQQCLFTESAFSWDEPVHLSAE